MVYEALKRSLKTVLPAGLLSQVSLSALVRERTGMRVAGGCFAGMSYVEGSVGSTFLPKLLGTYERELVPVIEEILRRRFEDVIDIGAAEGYYAVGLARALPGARVYAYEMTERGRALLAEMAKANGVADRVLIRGKCEVADLRDCLPPSARPLVVCDVEGYEGTLLDVESVPYLKYSFVLVEIHDTLEPGVGQLLKARFQPTHEIREICREDRDAADFPFRTFYTRLLPRRVLLNPLREWRPEGVNWFWMRPREA
jgi:hypothetical protein